jgi:hypothetical protein
MHYPRVNTCGMNGLYKFFRAGGSGVRLVRGGFAFSSVSLSIPKVDMT